MRLLFACALFAGCAQQNDSGGTDPGWGSGLGGYGGTSSYGCESDSDCGSSNVCARDGECLPPSEVRVIHVSWTLQGAAASAATCTGASDLEITFGDAEDQFGFAPVPCPEGIFTIDKLPTSYVAVGLMRNGDDSGGASGRLDPTTGDAMLDLPY